MAVGGRQRRRQARPRRRQHGCRHGVGAAEHDGAGRDHALLRRPADLRHRAEPHLRGGRRTSTATAGPTSLVANRQLQQRVGAAEHDGAGRGHRRPSPPSRPSPPGLHPSPWRSADVNGDGRPDLVVANYGSNSVSVLLNTTAPGARPSPRLRRPADLRHRQSDPFSVAVGGRQRRRQARPRRRQRQRRHGVGAAEHDGAGRDRAVLRRPADLRHGGSTLVPWRWGTSTATASPTSLVANDARRHGVGAAEHDGAGRDHPVLRRPADLRRRGRSLAPWRWRTSTATASPTSSSPTTTPTRCRCC